MRRSPRYQGPRTPIRTASRVTRKFFEMLEQDQIRQKDIERAIGAAAQMIWYWRSGKRTVNVMSFEQMVEAAGYRLVIERVHNG
jgi:hypothetical protein